MKKYMLKLKKGVILTESEKDKYNIKRRFKECEYLLFASDGYTLCPHMVAYKVRESSEFTQNKIDLIPNGLFKKFDVIDIEEDKYNVVCPVTSALLAVDKDNGNILWIDTGMYCDTNIFQRQFTESEIKEKFKCYANGTFMVKNN